MPYIELRLHCSYLPKNNSSIEGLIQPSCELYDRVLLVYLVVYGI